MSLKDLVALLLVVIMVFGIIKLMGALDKQTKSSLYLQEAVGLKDKAKKLTEERARQIKERERVLEQE